MRADRENEAWSRGVLNLRSAVVALAVVAAPAAAVVAGLPQDGGQLLAVGERRREVHVDGKAHPLVPGTACFLGYDVTHEIVNDSGEDLVMMWLITPHGLEEFFKAMGRPRTAGQPAPAPFARPEDIVAVERAMGMNDTRA